VLSCRNLVGDWHVNYEKLTDMIVPRSSRLIFEDNENALFSVTLFRKVVDDFKVHCRDKKFVFGRENARTILLIQIRRS
jgi:V-type H+-transporting ATPase subunit C